jgi:hypothetical protein
MCWGHRNLTCFQLSCVTAIFTHIEVDYQETQAWPSVSNCKAPCTVQCEGYVVTHYCVVFAHQTQVPRADTHFKCVLLGHRQCELPWCDSNCTFSTLNETSLAGSETSLSLSLFLKQGIQTYESKANVLYAGLFPHLDFSLFLLYYAPYYCVTW